MESNTSRDKSKLQSLLDIIENEESKETDVHHAIIQLIKLGDPRAVIPLKALSIRRNRFRWDAEMAVETIRDQWLEVNRKSIKKRSRQRLNRVERIVRKLYTWWGRVRLAKVAALGRTKDEHALPYLILLAIYGTSRVRRAALDGLGRLRHPDAVPVLINALSDGVYDVGAAAGRALVQIGAEAVEPLIQVVTARGGVSRLHAVKILGEIKDERAIPYLIECLKDGDTFLGSIEEEARGALLNYDEIAMEPLLNALINGDPLLRSEIIEIAKCYHDERFYEQISGLLDDPDTGVKTKAIQAMALRDGPEVPAMLIHAMSDEQEEVRKVAAHYLMLNPPEEALDVLIQALGDRSEHIRTDCVDALAKLRDKRAAAPLLELLWDPVQVVREKTVEALDKIQDWAIADTLVQRAAAPNATIESLEAFAAFGDTRAIPLLKKKSLESTHFDFQVRVEIAIARVVNQNHLQSRKLYCKKCFCWSKEYDSYSVGDGLVKVPQKYSACRICHGNFLLDPDIKRVKLVLDRSMAGLTQKEGAVLRINGLKVDRLCEIDELHVIDAQDADVERWIMKLKNDTDEIRRRRLNNIQIFLVNSHQLSQSKVNLLTDLFKVTMFNA